MKALYSLFAICLISFASFGQELICNVNVVTPNLKVVDPAVFGTFEESVFEFMNTRSWTPDKFKQTERIRMELNITITEELSADRFPRSDCHSEQTSGTQF